MLRKVALALMVLPILLFGVSAYAVDTSDYKWVGGDKKWGIDENGDMVPLVTNTYQLGTTTLYPSGIVLNGQLKESWGSVVSPMTDASGYVYPTDSGGVYRLYDAGYLSLGAGTAIDVYVLFDTDDDDWYIGRDDTDNDFAIGVGSTLGTDERISITDDATSTIVVIGDGVNAEDKQITFDGNALDYYIGYDDSADDLVFGVDSTVGTKPCFSILNETTPLLYVHNGIDAFGAVDLDVGSADVTDVTVVTDGGTLVLDGTITLTSLDVISNATDDTVRVASEDAASVLEVYTPLTSNGDSTLLLTADADADAGDRMAISHDGATNSMFFQSDTASADTLATILTLAKTGIITTTAAINVEVDDASNTTVSDVLNLQHFTSGTAAAGIGAGLTFDLENGVGTEEEHAYIDIVATSSTDGAEDTDVVIGVMSAGALAEVVRVVAASSATVGDSLIITSNTTETNAITDILSLANVTGTAAANTGLGITWDFEDASGAEEQASLDVQLIDETNATEDADFIFSQQSAGAVTETLRIAGTQSATASSRLQFTGTTSETNGIVDILTLIADSSGTAAANMGAGISVQVDDAGGLEEGASLDFQLTTETNGAEDMAVIISQQTAGAIAETLRIQGASSATVGDSLEFTSNTTETDAVLDIVKLKIATGTAANGSGIGISFEPEDATGSEQHASIDVVQTTAARATNDTDFVFTQDINGTMTERVRFDADAGTATLAGATPLYLGGATPDAYYTIIAVADAASSSKTVTVPSITSSVSLEKATTTVITADTTASIVVTTGTDVLYTYTIDTDNENCTLTFSAGGTIGDRATIIFITDAAGSADEVMTFDGTLSDTEGTLTLANGASKRYVITFISDGTIWNEVSRTAVLG